jgi:hypothetical protein
VSASADYTNSGGSIRIRPSSSSINPAAAIRDSAALRCSDGSTVNPTRRRVVVPISARIGVRAPPRNRHRASFARADEFMGISVMGNPEATPEPESADDCHADGAEERDGKSRALDCLAAAIDASLVPRKLLAAECDMSESYFSKVCRGEQGDWLALLYKLRPSIRQDFICRFAESERSDPEERAAEQLLHAALRFLRLRSAKAYPAPRMAKASLR